MNFLVLRASKSLFTWFLVSPVCLANICLSPSVGYLVSKILESKMNVGAYSKAKTNLLSQESSTSTSNIRHRPFFIKKCWCG
jgi:hypothetical protein